MKILLIIALSVGVNFTSVGLLSGQDSEKARNAEDRAKIQEKYAATYNRMTLLGQVINNKQVAEDLQIVNSQKKAIKNVLLTYSNKLRSIYIEVSVRVQEVANDDSISDEQKTLALEKIRFEQAEKTIPLDLDAIAKIEAELLPHQFDRLNQLVAQLATIRKPYSRFSGLIYLFEELGVPKQDQPEAKKKLVELQKEYEKRLQELQQKYQKELVKRMSEDTRNKFNELVGNKGKAAVEKQSDK